MRTIIAAALTLLAAERVSALEFGPVGLSASATAVSDYRFRGGSLSGGNPALTASLDARLPHGVFVGAFGASRGGYRGGDAEVDVYGGWSGALGLVSTTAGVTHYAYPGGGQFTEAFASAARTLGPVTGTLGVNYAPRQRGLGREDNVYVYGQVSAGIPLTPLTVRASAGREAGGRVRAAGAGGAKIDYAVGVEARLFGLATLGVRYVGSDVRCGAREFHDAIVVSGGVSF